MTAMELGKSRPFDYCIEKYSNKVGTNNIRYETSFRDLIALQYAMAKTTYEYFRVIL